MPDDLGSFRVDMVLENPARPGEQRTLRSALVATGAELSCVPAEVLELVSVAGKRAGDEVVFGEPGDLVLLGSRTLEGLNFRVEPVTKQLVDAGPAPAAVAGSLAVTLSLAALGTGRRHTSRTRSSHPASAAGFDDSPCTRGKTDRRSSACGRPRGDRRAGT